MITIQNLTKRFHSRKSEVLALNKVNLHINKGEFVLIKGPSGCGKSTLLFTLGGMLKPSIGSISVDQQDIYKLSEAELQMYRARQIGFVYQSYHLVPYLNILENILLVNQTSKEVASYDDVVALAKQFNLENRLYHKPAELSVGEKQRAALMRALMVKPQILIADEPTGNLDPENSEIIMKHFKDFQQQGGTVIMASHGNEADKLATVTVYMKDGEIINKPIK